MSFVLIVSLCGFIQDYNENVFYHATLLFLTILAQRHMT